MSLTLKQKLTVARNFAVEIPIEILHFFIVPIALLACDEKAKICPNGQAGLMIPTTASTEMAAGKTSIFQTEKIERIGRAFAGYTATA